MAIRGHVPAASQGRAVWTGVTGILKKVLALGLAFAVSGCLSNNAPLSSASPFGNLGDPLAPTRDLRPREFVATTSTSTSAPSPSRSRGIASVGDDLFVSDPLPDGRLYQSDGKNDVTLNLVDVDIVAAAKTIVTDILGQNLVVDDKVAGTVTLQTIRPISRAALIDLFETVLAAKGYTLVRTRDTYRVADVGSGGRAGGNGSGLPIGVGGSGLGPGLSAQVIPLRYISAEDMRNLLTSVAPKEAVVAADSARNFLIVSGTRAQITAILETVGLFDVDWMRGMSAAIFPLKSNNPTATAEELEQLFGSAGGPLRGTIKILPNTHLNAVLVITSRAEYLRRARELIARLEDMALRSESQFFVYKVENRSAKELAEVVKGMLSQGGGSSSGSGGLSPKLTAATTSSSGFGKPADGAAGEAGDAKSSGFPSPDGSTGGPGGDGLAQGSDKSGAGAFGALASSKAGAAADLGSSPSSGGGSGQGGNAPTIVADEQNNSIIITGTRIQYERVLQILTKLDSPPIQVLLEAVIAEVTLNDELKFGVRWFLNQKHYKFSEADDATSSNAATLLSGLNFSTTVGQIDALLNMLSSVTEVKVVSTPSLTVLDNHAAHLQIGDEVPIVKSSSTNTASNTAATVTDVEYKNTGVILSVTPRVNQNGLVLLDVEQEVSDVTNTTSSGINSPTIQQRKVSTTVIVKDGQTLALGGLVQDKKSNDRTRFPVLGDMPVIGPFMGSTTNSKTRTELMVFVRPQVIRNTVEARQVTDEFRSQLGRLFKVDHTSRWRQKFDEDVDRLAQ
ncbi:type II secretion system secretin GspD [Lichenifustis flavocetrariae]|uniref:Type II secretion system secretin GspD n=1 Tax=Lichenifustis flavocetrariae TaxID=2949735 RepID=A0AA41YWL7_9HYPH|nr:type II secretion system secretin GspD [Lichenifustis flavocetrariae]MCW6509921.1 type II secretion system secretin GspD [Lichenifustis flavocetrariae]